MSSISNPKVTVLMPIHNGEAFLHEAIDSVLTQNFGEFEFLIIDDGCTDRSLAIIASYTDPRIRLVQNGNRLGLVKSLNKGLDLARGKYVARMDCDDISLPQRLARQVAFMDRHSQVGVCGTWVKTIGEPAGDLWRYPSDPEIIRCRLLFESVIAHPSVLMRRTLFGKASLSYSSSYPRAEDYELWVRSAKTSALSNIPAVLLLRRVHSQQVGVCERVEQRVTATRIRTAQIEELGIEPTRPESALHESISLWEFQTTKEFVMQAHSWLKKLKAANERSSLYPDPAFSKVLGERWFAVCNAASGLGPWAWEIFEGSTLRPGAGLSWKKRFKLFLKTRFAA